MSNNHRLKWRRDKITDAIMRYTMTVPHRRSAPNPLGDWTPQVFQSRIEKMLDLCRPTILIEISDPALTLPTYLVDEVKRIAVKAKAGVVWLFESPIPRLSSVSPKVVALFGLFLMLKFVVENHLLREWSDFFCPFFGKTQCYGGRRVGSCL